MKTRPGSLVLNAALAGVMTLAIAGCSKPQEVATVPPPATTVGTEIDDSVVTARVKTALFADADVKGFDFNIETRKGQVQLSGFVDSQAQAERAITLAREVPGVKGIENHVSLKGAPTTIGEKIDDGIVTSQVKTALLADASIESADIAVITRNGEVQLSGFVDHQGQIDRAIELTRSINGVSGVGNEMSIKK
jgi:hyperosmotically inducible periplasmic protein